jgi:dipeptidyl aminopeptidase/acylaminoacyl peptidase
MRAFMLAGIGPIYGRESAVRSLFLGLLLLVMPAWSQDQSAAAPATRPRLAIGSSPGPTFDLAWVGRIVRVSDPQFSPDGKSLVAVITRPDYEHDLNVAELALVNVAGGKVRYLTHDRKTVSFPRWSPAGDRLAFLAQDGEKHNQIYILDMAGGDALQVTHHPTAIQQFAWKPNGMALAYAAIDEAVKKTGADQFDDAFEVGDNDFLVKEKSLPTHLWTVSAVDGSDPKNATTRLTSGSWSLPVAFPPGPPASPISFTPDGRRLIYVRLENTYSGDRNNSSLQVLDIATGKSAPITTHTRFDSFPVVSPDGKHLAYIYPRDGDNRNYTDIYVTAGLSGNGDNLTRNLDRDVFRALWTPDGRAIVTGANDGATTALWMQTLDGTPQRLALGNLSLSGAYWLDASVGPQNQVAFVASAPHHPTEIYLTDAEARQPRQLTDFNAAFDDASALTLGTSQVIDWKSPDPSPKNWRENGILTYPPHYQAGRKLPLVLYIHGGPRSSSKDAFNIFAQMIAAQGWLVFEPNYRGSDNEGNDFQHAITDDSGDGPGRDVLAGLDAIKKLGIVDESNIAVTGWSYGGYMTSWLIGHANFWKAAIAGAPVTNLIDQYNLSDANVARASAIGGSPYTGEWMKHWIEQSPITYYANMVTPTLVLQDTGDYRVTISQGYALYHALKDRGVRTEFYAYPIGGHSPSDPVRIRDVYRRWIEWLEQYLPRA